MNRQIFFVIFLIFSMANTYISAQNGKIFFDVKTKWAEKTELTHIKNMLDYLILQTDWASVTEIGEEYELWLLDYSKTQDENVFTVKLDLEIRKPKSIGKGELVICKNIDEKFVIALENDRVNTHFELYKQKYNNISDELITEAVTVGERVFRELEQLRYRLE